MRGLGEHFKASEKVVVPLLGIEALVQDEVEALGRRWTHD